MIITIRMFDNKNVDANDDGVVIIINDDDSNY